MKLTGYVRAAASAQIVGELIGIFRLGEPRDFHDELSGRSVTISCRPPGDLAASRPSSLYP